MIIDWIIGEIGNKGDYTYGPIHIGSLLLMIASTILVIVYGLSKASKDNKERLLKVICIFQLSFEIIWRILYIIFKKVPSNELWPMYPCNLGGVLIPIIGLFDIKPLKKCFYLFGIVGAVLTFAMPDGIFSNDILVFPIVKSILQHTGLILIPTYEFFMGKYKTNIKDFPYVFIGCCIHLFNCEVVNRLIALEDKDYIFLNSGLPFVIPGVWQPLTFCVFACLVFLLLCYLCDIKTSNAFIKEKIKKKYGTSQS